MAGRLAMLYAVEAATRKGGRGKTGADSAHVSDRKTRAKAAKAAQVSHPGQLTARSGSWRGAGRPTRRAPDAAMTGLS
jgi:hypothetical protein